MLQVRFFQEIRKSLEFQRRATSAAPSDGRNNNDNHTSKKNKRKLWTVARSVWVLDSVEILLSLLTMICFTVYWLIIDPSAVFLFETVHYLNTFFVMIVSFYFTVRKFGLCAKVCDTFFDWLWTYWMIQICLIVLSALSPFMETFALITTRIKNKDSFLCFIFYHLEIITYHH